MDSIGKPMFKTILGGSFLMAKKGSSFNKYTFEFKIMVVEDYLSGNSGGLIPVAKKHGVKSEKQIREWLKKYRVSPELLKEDKRGSNTKGRAKTVKLDEMTLKEQNEFLRMENAILKKLKALQRN